MVSLCCLRRCSCRLGQCHILELHVAWNNDLQQWPESQTFCCHRYSFSVQPMHFSQQNISSPFCFASTSSQQFLPHLPKALAVSPESWASFHYKNWKEVRKSAPCNTETSYYKTGGDSSCVFSFILKQNKSHHISPSPHQ